MNRRLFFFASVSSACLAPFLTLLGIATAKPNKKPIRHDKFDWTNLPHIDWIDDSWNHVRDGLPPVSDKIYECLTSQARSQGEFFVFRARRIEPTIRSPDAFWANGVISDGKVSFSVCWGVDYWRETF